MSRVAPPPTPLPLPPDSASRTIEARLDVLQAQMHQVLAILGRLAVPVALSD